MFFSISVPRVSIDGKPHETLALVVCASGLVIATIIIAIIAILLRKVNRIEIQKIKTLTRSHDIETPPLESVKKASESIEVATVFETTENIRVCEPIGHTTHVMERPNVRIFTIFGLKKQCFDLK